MSRIIRRYPNRRLYDTEESRYVSLDDLKRLVLSATSFEVKDSKTHEDVTHAILLQILFDQESASASSTPLFSEALLRSFICFYSHPMGATVMAPYLEKSLEAFQQGYMQWTQHLAPEQLTPQNWQKWWQHHMQSWLNPIPSSAANLPSTWNPWANWWSTFQPQQDTSSSAEDADKTTK